MTSNSAQFNGDSAANGPDQESPRGLQQSDAETTDGGSQQINVDASQNTQQGNNVEPGAGSSHASSMPHDMFQHHIRSLIDLQTELNSQLFDLRVVFDAHSFTLSDADLEGIAGFFSYRMPSNDPWRIRRGRRLWFRRVHTGQELVVLGPYPRLQVELEIRMQLTTRFGGS